MTQPAITLKRLQNEIGDEGKARDLYKKISLSFGFGNVATGYVGGPPPLDINSLSEAKQGQINAMIESAKTQVKDAAKAEADTSDKSTKRGK